MIKACWRWTADIEAEIVREIEGLYPVIHVCSGSSGIGDIRIDRFFDQRRQLVESHGVLKKLSGTPNTRADMRFLPIRSGTAAAVISDPPYDIRRFKAELPLLLNELVRITAPRGKVIMLCPWVMYHPTLKVMWSWLRKPGIQSFPTYKILSVSMKENGQITDY